LFVLYNTSSTPLKRQRSTKEVFLSISKSDQENQPQDKKNEEYNPPEKETIQIAATQPDVFKVDSQYDVGGNLATPDLSTEENSPLIFPSRSDSKTNLRNDSERNKNKIKKRNVSSCGMDQEGRRMNSTVVDSGMNTSIIMPKPIKSTKLPLTMVGFNRIGLFPKIAMTIQNPINSKFLQSYQPTLERLPSSSGSRKQITNKTVLVERMLEPPILPDERTPDSKHKRGDMTPNKERSYWSLTKSAQQKVKPRAESQRRGPKTLVYLG